jgi:hypothetical protein
MLRLRDNGIAWREIDGEIVALDPGSSRYVSINGAGATLWRRLHQGEATLEELAEALVERYGIGREQAHADAGAFVQQLADVGWLTG